MQDAKEYIYSLAKDQGFELCGFAKAEELSEEIEHYRSWVAEGNHAGMLYLDKNYDKKANPTLVLESAKSVIVLGHLYKCDNDKEEFSGNDGIIARYARGDDYHEVLADKADSIIKAILLKFPCDCKRYVDTGPVLERAWAVRSGIGWQGKNGNIINKDIGSYFFLTVIYSSLDLSPDEPAADYCGTCLRCIHACPTDAIISPKQVDSRRCLSYLNIEAKINEPIPEELQAKFGNRLFGCDICQEVCPWNAKKIFTLESKFSPRNSMKTIDLLEVQSMEQSEFSARFKNSPIKRKKLAGLKMIAEMIMKS